MKFNPLITATGVMLAVVVIKRKVNMIFCFPPMAELNLIPDHVNVATDTVSVLYPAKEINLFIDIEVKSGHSQAFRGHTTLSVTALQSLWLQSCDVNCKECRSGPIVLTALLTTGLRFSYVNSFSANKTDTNLYIYTKQANKRQTFIPLIFQW